jgi:phosphoglycolate phosphatase
MTHKAVIFDLDGTLVDTAPDLWRATNHVMTLCDRREVTLDEVRAFVGHGARKLIARGLAATGEPLADQDIESLYKEFVAYYSDNIAHASAPFPGCLTLLDRLKGEGIRLGICTNKLEGLSVKLIEALGMSSYFEAVVGPDTIGIGKPDPAVYRETLRRMRGDISRSLLIGDSETDVLTARAAGVPIIAVTFGYTADPIASFAPDALISDFAEAYGPIAAALKS